MSDTNSPKIYSLLVGINTWKWDKIKPLVGCLNDVDLMKETLVDHFSVSEDHIQVIKEEKATHAAIKEAFRSHLIENAKKLANDDSAAFFFHYSGHGSRCKNPAKPLGKDESIVPWDSRLEGVVDIKDWELGEMIDELTQYSNNVTIVLDCCHSGSGTRDLLTTRECQEDTSDQPDLIAHQPGTRSITATVQATEPTMKSPEKFALLAGCRSDQGAHEYEHKADGKVTPYGLTTFMLCEELKKTETKQLTYREILAKMTPEVQRVKPQQIPQCEGDVDRVFLSPYRPLRNLYLKIKEIRDGFYWVDGGLAHGLTERTQLHVYPKDSRRAAEGEKPLATMIVDKVGAIASGCVVLGDSAVLPVGARVAVHRVFRNTLQRTVSVSGASEQQRDSLKARADQPDVKGMFEFIGDDSGEIQVEFVGGRWGVKAAGTAKFWSGETELDLLVSRMKELTQYVNVLAIKNHVASSELAGKVKLTLKKQTMDPETGARVNKEIMPAADGTIELIAKKDAFVFEVSNLSSKKLWFVVLAFGYDGSIAQLYPRNRGEHQKLRENMQEAFVSRRLKPGFAKGEEHNSGVIETIKVIASTEETDFECLLRNRIASTPPPAPSGTGTRLLFDDEDAAANDNWTTAEVNYRIVTETPPKQHQQLVNQQATHVSGTSLQIIPPAGFEASIGVAPLQSSQRSLEAVPQTSAIDRLQAVGSPLNWRSTRSIGEASVELDLELEKDQLAVVTHDNPILLRSSEFEQDDDYVVVATDGELLFPVGGSADPGVVSIDWLPPEESLSNEGTATTRSLGRRLKLYVFKLLKWPVSSLGLHSAMFVPTAKLSEQTTEAADRVVAIANGEVRYRTLESTQLKTGQRVAIFVHGFNSDTTWLVHQMSELLESSSFKYDHVLTFDYESIGTGVRENGKALADALKKAGLSKDDGIHVDVIAHSMGCVVSRCMIELEGGNEFVDRCFMAGPPNLGTPLADTGKLLTGFATTLINFASGSTIAEWAGKALKNATKVAVGPTDLSPSSKLYEELNKSEPAGTVPYYVLAGSAKLSTDAQGRYSSLWNGLNFGGNLALSSMFDGKHDLVIGVNSMIGVQKGKYPAHLLHTKVVDSDHFEYLRKPEAQQQLTTWLQAVEK